MILRRYAFWMTTVLFLAAAAVPAQAAEIFDHPDIGRYKGSTAVHQEGGSFAEYTLGLGPARDGKVSEVRRVTGKVLMTLYGGPENSSAFEIYTAYRNLLESRGYRILFDCSKGECGEKFPGAFYDLAPFANDYGWNNSAPVTQGSPEFYYVLVARSESAGRETYVTLVVSQGWWKYPAYKLDVVETGSRAGAIESVTGPDGETGVRTGSASAAGTRVAERGPARLGLQISSDGFLGLLWLSDRFEFCIKARATLYDGFPGGVEPDNEILMTGVHSAYLVHLSPDLDLGVGLDFRYGITLSGDIVYRQYIDAGPRIDLNYRLGERLVVSGVVFPAWVVVRETDVDDSFELTAQVPAAALALSFLF